MYKPEPMTLEEMLKRKDFICSTNVERSLYELLENIGLKKEDIVSGKYDNQCGKAKERIYLEFSKMLGLEFFWEGFYHLVEKDVKNNPNKT